MKEKKISKKKRIVIIAASICMIAAAAYGIYRWIVQSNMDEEVAKRESWAVETGELLSGNTQTKSIFIMRPKMRDTDLSDYSPGIGKEQLQLL